MIKKVIYVIRVIVIIIIIAIVVFIVGSILITILKNRSNPLSRTNEQIRADMLELFPIGTSMDDVIQAIENNDDWTIRLINHRHGYSFDRDIPRTDNSGTIIIGEQYIKVYIGQYTPFVIIDVSLFFGFDENSMLIDIAVKKERDGL